MADFQDPDRPSRALTIWIVLSVVAVIAVGAWAFMNRSFSEDVGQAANAVGDAATAVREAVQPLLDSVAGEETPAEAPVATAEVAPADTGRRTGARKPAAPPAEVAPLAGPLAMAPDEAGARAVSGTTPPPPPPDYRGDVFDASDAAVVPPSLVTPLANAPLPRETLKSAEPLSIEILVNPDGTVASARVTSEPTNMTETLQVVNALSIAKSWTFGPAVKDGQQVRYRMWVALDKVLMWRSAIKNERP